MTTESGVNVVTFNQPDTKSNSNPTTKQYAVISIQLNSPLYYVSREIPHRQSLQLLEADRLSLRGNSYETIAPFLLLSIVIVVARLPSQINHKRFIDKSYKQSNELESDTVGP